jgi:hypothetical protein
MKGFRSVLRSAAITLSAVAVLASQAAATPVVPPPAVEGLVVPVQGDCYAIGEQIAAQNGGTLAKASPSTQGGQPVCVIVVLVPGKEGQRPRRVQMVVPQG